MDAFERLVRNPNMWISLHRDKDGISEVVVHSSVKGDQLRINKIQKNDQLCRILAEYLSNEDNVTLDSEVIERFCELGVLIKPELISSNVKYSCVISDTTAVDTQLTNAQCKRLKINPKVWWNQDPELSEICRKIFAAFADLDSNPNLLWVEDPLTKVKWPYWVKGKLTDIITSLLNKKLEIANIDKPYIELLFAMDFLVNGGTLDIDKATVLKQEFSEKWYSEINGLIPNLQANALADFYFKEKMEGLLCFGDRQVEGTGRFRSDNEIVATFIHQQLLDFAQRVFISSIEIGGVYLSGYIPGALLKKHKDHNKDFEFNLAVFIDHKVEQGEFKAWPLYFDSGHKNDETKAPKLGPGDAVAYWGAKVPHYRIGQCPDGQFITTLVFGYKALAK